MGSEWSRAPLEEVAEVIDSRHKTPQYADEGLPMVRVVDVKGGRLSLDETKKVSQVDYDDYSKGRDPEIGDLLISRVGSYGNIAYVDNDEKFCLGQNTALIIPKIHWRYLYYQLISPSTKAQIEQQVVGAVQKTISLKTIRALEIPLPPLPDQKAIAHILGTLDDKIELNRRMNATLEGMAQALFKSWFVDFDPVIDNALAAGNPIPDELAARAEVRRQARANGTANREAARLFPAAFQHTEAMGWIPEGWEIGCFGEASTCFDRKRIPLSKKQREEKKPGQIPYYGATSIMDFIDEWIFDDTYLLIGEDGSVIKEDGSPFVQYIWGKSWVNNHAHVLQGKAGTSTEHLMLFMQSQNIAAYVTGAVQLKINQKNMNSIPFLRAGDLVNQQFAEYISPFYKRMKLLAEDKRSLTKIRDTLLPKLISGELQILEVEEITKEALV
jgi:type I restriction enzyme, S subunit